MNRQYRLVWNKRLRMRVAVAESARATGKGAAGETVVATAPAGAIARAGSAWQRALAALGAASLLSFGGNAWAGLSLPSGSLLDINSSASYSSGWTHYSLGFTPVSSGNNYFLFAFRQDPAFWTFGQVSLTASGSSTNLFTNPDFATGGELSGQSGLQAPANWGIVYQSGTTPSAAGSWQSGFNDNASAGSWYDGAVGSFDGIYQGVTLDAGTNYTVGFTLYGDDPASAANGIEVGVFAGPCVTLSGPVGTCTPANPDFVALATPDDAANAGTPATDIDTSANEHLASKLGTLVNPKFNGGRLKLDASASQDFTVTAQGGTIDQAGNLSTLSGVIADAEGESGGTLTITNSGTGGSVTFSNVNTYTGKTVIAAAAKLALAGTGSIANSISVVADGTLDISGTDSGAFLQSLAGSGTLDLGARTLALTAASASDVFSGTVTGTGDVRIIGGTATFTGSNTYQGGTSIETGATLRIAADANLGAASGGLGLNGGRLQTLASFTTARNISLGAQGGIFHPDTGTTLTLAGSVSGSGAMTKEGEGTLILAGDNAGPDHLPGTGWTGGLTIDAGLVQVTNAWGLGWGDVAINGGSLQTLVDIRTGQNIGLAPGTVVNTAADTVTTLGGDVTMSGTGGCFVKNGQGTLNMTGRANIASGTCVDQGLLRANGTLTGNVFVESDGRLGGAGLIRGDVLVRGKLSPGNSPGYLTIAGNVGMASGSTYQEDIAGTVAANAGTPIGVTGYYSALNVTSGGVFAIDANTTLAPMLKGIFSASEPGFGSTPYTPVLGDRFRIVTAEGGVQGRFGSIAQPDGLAPDTRFAAFYNVFGNNSIDLVVIPTSYGGLLAGSNRNVRSVAAALDRIVDTDQAGNANTAQDQLLYMAARQGAGTLPATVQALAGEVHGALAAASARSGQSLQDTVAGQLALAHDDVTPRSALWIEMAANQGHWHGDDASSGFRDNRSQVTVGADLLQQRGTRAGVGVSHANSNIAAQGGNGQLDETLAFAYGEHALGGFVVDALAGYGRTTSQSGRDDPLGLAISPLATSVHGSTMLAGAGIRAPWKLAGATVSPFARVLVQKVKRDAASEGSASPAALDVDSFSETGVRMVTGLSGASAQTDPLQGVATWRYSAGLGYDAGALARPTVDASLAGERIAIAGPQIGRPFVQLSATGTLPLGKASYLYYGVNGEARRGQNELGLHGGVRVAF